MNQTLNRVYKIIILYDCKHVNYITLTDFYINLKKSIAVLLTLSKKHNHGKYKYIQQYSLQHRFSTQPDLFSR